MATREDYHLPMKTIFAHESGGTFEMRHSLVSTGRDRFSHCRKPAPLVSDATRAAEQVDGFHPMTGYTAASRYAVY